MNQTVQYTPEKLVKVNNLEINYDAFGNKEDPAIVLIIGLGGQMIEWQEKFCETLASNGYYVIRFDNRDAGLSTKLDSLPVPNISNILQDIQEERSFQVPYDLSDLAKDTVGLLDRLGIKSVHLIGHSMGGGIAQIIAIEYPERVKSLIIISSTGNLILSQIKRDAMAVLINTPSPEREKYIEDTVHLWRVETGPFIEIDEDSIRELAGKAFDRCFYPDGTTRQFAAVLDSGNRNERLKKLQIKTLVIHGEVDPIIPVESAEITSNSIQGSKMVVIKGMGHTVPDKIVPQIISEILNHIKSK